MSIRNRNRVVARAIVEAKLSAAHDQECPMMKAFDENDPSLAINARVTGSDRDQRFGYRYIFAGAQSGIRHPRGHEVDLPDDPDMCLDHLLIASVLLRKLDATGLR